jgi:hypothetical protein
MNGDNDLSQEVLHALDMMETIGSSDMVEVIALVDGHPKWLGSYAAEWSGTRLLHLCAHPQIGRITSPVLEEWGEADLGAPETLERFVNIALTRYPAQRYLFYMFAHGRGVIDTGNYHAADPGKTLSISRDVTSGKQMTLDQFHRALKIGLNGRCFDLMVLFSCLANMVEVGYTLNDVTRYLVGSQDEIRLVNQPPGRFQIRGLGFEQLIADLNENPAADMQKLGQALVDSHVNNYGKDLKLPLYNGTRRTCRFEGSMALVDVPAMGKMVQILDSLARELIRQKNEPAVTQAMQTALSTTQSFASFLNLEYYDLYGFVSRLRNAANAHSAIKDQCSRILNLLTDQVIVYSRHTRQRDAAGMSIYLSHPNVPDNIFEVHQALYRANRFSRDTHWDEMIHLLRPLLKTALISNPN